MHVVMTSQGSLLYLEVLGTTTLYMLVLFTMENAANRVRADFLADRGRAQGPVLLADLTEVDFWENSMGNEKSGKGGDGEVRARSRRRLWPRARDATEETPAKDSRSEISAQHFHKFHTSFKKFAAALQTHQSRVGR